MTGADHLTHPACNSVSMMMTPWPPESVKTMPTLTFTGEDMMMHGHTEYNDSRSKGGKNVFDYQPMSPTQTAHIYRTFGIHNDHVKEVFSRP